MKLKIDVEINLCTFTKFRFLSLRRIYGYNSDILHRSTNKPNNYGCRQIETRDKIILKSLISFVSDILSI